MKKLHKSVPVTARPVFSSASVTMTAVLAICALFLGFSKLAAQSTSSVDFKTLPFSVSIPSVTLSAGESVLISIQVGTAASPIEAGRGYQLSVYLGDNAARTSSLSPSSANSWLSTAAPMESHAASSNRYDFELEASEAASGNGPILQLQLTSLYNNVSAASLFQSAGGIMIIDNLDFRMAAPQHELSFGPNPLAVSQGQTMVQVQAGDAPILSTQLIDLQGKTLQTFAGSAQLDLSGMSPGLYFLCFHTADDKTNSQKLLIR